MYCGEKIERHAFNKLNDVQLHFAKCLPFSFFCCCFCCCGPPSQSNRDSSSEFSFLGLFFVCCCYRYHSLCFFCDSFVWYVKYVAGSEPPFFPSSKPYNQQISNIMAISNYYYKQEHDRIERNWTLDYSVSAECELEISKIVSVIFGKIVYKYLHTNRKLLKPITINYDNLSWSSCILIRKW